MTHFNVLPLPQSQSWKSSAFVRVASQRCCDRWLVQCQREDVWPWSLKVPGRALISCARARKKLSTGSVASARCRKEWRTWQRKKSLTNILFLFFFAPSLYLWDDQCKAIITSLRSFIFVAEVCLFLFFKCCCLFMNLAKTFGFYVMFSLVKVPLHTILHLEFFIQKTEAVPLHNNSNNIYKTRRAMSGALCNLPYVSLFGQGKKHSLKVSGIGALWVTSQRDKFHICF